MARARFGYLSRMNRSPAPRALVSSAVLVAVALVAVLPVAGCASAPRAAAPEDPAGSVPGDLTVEVAVRPGRGVEQRVKIEERPARFVLLPDGALFGEADAPPRDGVRPARARRLAREQMADVWTLLRSSGFADAALAETTSNPALLAPAAGEILATLEVCADGRRFAFVRRYKPGAEDEVAMRRVVRSLASLAWASDEVLVESAELPKRYDLGVDPYARFARPATAPEGGK